MIPVGKAVEFTSGEYRTMTGVITGIIPRYLKGETETYRIQIDGCKPAGWNGKVTATEDKFTVCND
jgi:hypothetical protein